MKPAKGQQRLSRAPCVATAWSAALLVAWCVAGAVGQTAPAGTAVPPVDVFSEDVARFTRLLDSPVAARRTEGLQGLSNLKHWQAEERVLHLLDDGSADVRREALLALCRLGTSRSVPRLIGVLGDRSWELRENATLALRRMTALDFDADQKADWQAWWKGGAATNHERVLWEAATNSQRRIARADARRALRHFATPASEEALIRHVHAPGLSVEERNCICDALERVGTAKAIPALAGYHSDASAWALGRIGGADAEKALLRFPKSLPVLVNLDRLHSTNCGSLVPYLVGHMGLVTYRGQPDDLMNHDAQPVQRVAANLIRRSGLAPLFVEIVVQELEDSMKPPVKHGPRPAAPEDWTPMFAAMREELQPGFVRGDGTTTSQPLTALCHVADDPALADRLRPLLRHPAFVPRLYVAMTLGVLRCTNALPDLVSIIREGYPFSDATALASGKHFDQSQTVRWRGFLCMALGRMGGEDARQALEALAADARQPRDIRYSSAVGLGFIGSPRSLPVLEQVATNDIIWMVRDEAARAAADIEQLRAEEAR